MGQEEQVAWELEPGRQRVIGGAASLPKPPDSAEDFDDPDDLAAFLDAMRWGAVSSADPRSIQSPFRSGITIEDYQLEPVVRAIRMPRANLLIADDVGLGKTIEAGLVAQELLTRHRIHQVLIVCPASLLVKWQEEMRDKFGLDFVIVNTELMRKLRRERGPHVNPWSHHQRLITSMEWFRKEGHGGPLQLFRETLPGPGDPLYPRRYGLLIVDEADKVAPKGSGKVPVDSLQTAAIRVISPHFEHKLFLTATPHSGSPRSFSALLHLLDDQRFVRGLERQDEVQKDAVVVRRLKTELTQADGKTPRFHARKVEALEVAYGQKEKDLYGQLVQYGELLRAVKFDGSRGPVEFVLQILKKRMLSSPQAFVHTLQKHVRTLRGLKDDDSPKRARRPSPGVLERFLEDAQSEYADDDAYEDELGDAMERASSMFEAMPDKAQGLLRAMADTAEQACHRPDSKAKKLFEFIDETCCPDGEWNDERIIVFTEYRTTQNWLIGLMANKGIRDPGRLRVLYGGMDSDERERIKNEFQAEPDDEESEVRILLATDMASFGIDLQNHCHRLVHYEIPWSPSVLEQRSGRIDRHGQDSPPLIYHFVAEGFASRSSGDEPEGSIFEGDQAFLAVVVRKLEEQSADLHGKVNPVIASQVKERMLGKRKDLDIPDQPHDPNAAARMLASRRRIAEEVKALRERLDQSRDDLHIHPGSIRRVVDLALRFAGQPRLMDAELKGVWPDPDGKREQTPVFLMPALTDGWAACAVGVIHPLSGKVRPITFDHDVAKKRDKVVLAHLNHPLVRMSQMLLRAEADEAEGQGQLRRFSVREVSSDELAGPSAIVWGRLLVLGGDGQRIHEELISAAVRYKDGRTRRVDTVSEVDRLSALQGQSVEEDVLEATRSAWSTFSEPLTAALEARVKARTANLESIVQRRTKEEASKVKAIFAELSKQIETELKDRKTIEASLFKEEEEREFMRDTKGLREELQNIDARMASEVEQVVKRFADPHPRNFPVAVELLVPKGWKGI